MTDARSIAPIPKPTTAASVTELYHRRPGWLRARLTALAGLLAIAIYWNLPVASEFHCLRGQVAEADLGDGVLMRTCLWEREPERVIRVGPLELIKNGVLILKTQTDGDGKLHGQFSSWSDSGLLIERGRYRQGLKQGSWMITDNNGTRRFLHYRNGVLSGL